MSGIPNPITCMQYIHYSSYWPASHVEKVAHSNREVARPGGTDSLHFSDMELIV